MSRSPHCRANVVDATLYDTSLSSQRVGDGTACLKGALGWSYLVWGSACDRDALDMTQICRGQILLTRVELILKPHSHYGPLLRAAAFCSCHYGHCQHHHV